ncbi:hypothetical protein BC829DRAFT_391987 [Chytridium lagenaria]|nr:hypothetical protein BC829DRAFT_391987 [Chytridium lagenaria]
MRSSSSSPSSSLSPSPSSPSSTLVLIVAIALGVGPSLFSSFAHAQTFGPYQFTGCFLNIQGPIALPPVSSLLEYRFSADCDPRPCVSDINVICGSTAERSVAIYARGGEAPGQVTLVGPSPTAIAPVPGASSTAAAPPASSSSSPGNDGGINDATLTSVSRPVTLVTGSSPSNTSTLTRPSITDAPIATSSTDSQSSSSSLPIAAVAGIVIGVLAIIVLSIAGILYARRAAQTKRAKDEIDNEARVNAVVGAMMGGGDGASGPPPGAVLIGGSKPGVAPGAGGRDVKSGYASMPTPTPLVVRPVTPVITPVPGAASQSGLTVDAASTAYAAQWSALQQQQSTNYNHPYASYPTPLQSYSSPPAAPSKVIEPTSFPDPSPMDDMDQQRPPSPVLEEGPKPPR